MKKKEITFGKVKIQKLNRIALPKALLDNLNLDIGSEIELFLDLEKEEIKIKEGKKNEK